MSLPLIRRLGLVIVGNARTLSRNMLWGCLIVTMRDNNCLATGSLNALMSSEMKIKEPAWTREDSEGRYRMTALGGGRHRTWGDGKWDEKREKPRRKRGQRIQHDSRYDPRYEQSSQRKHDDDSSLGFAPLPDFEGDYSYQDSDQRSVGGASSNSSNYMPYTQGSQSQSDMSAYMHQGSQFSQDSGFYSDYYFGDSMSETSSRR